MILFQLPSGEIEIKRIAQVKPDYSKIREEDPSLVILKEPTLECVAEYISNKSVKNIIVLAGAGISTSAGIPDFRSPDTGLYSNLQKYNLPSPEAIFHIEYFKKNPKPFFTLAKEMYPGQFKPTPTHYFIRLLAEKGMLKRVFTQNVDTLERLAGIPDELIVEAHGSFHTASCISCKHNYNGDLIREKVMNEEIPLCDSCKSIIKPDIVFFGEQLPNKFFKSMHEDFEICDLLLVMGTSLKVYPFGGLLTEVNRDCPRVLINMEETGLASKGNRGGFDFEGNFGKYLKDAKFIGSCDDGCFKLATIMGWKDELEQLVGSNLKPTSQKN